MSIFGQNPADITGALFKVKNLADVPDKAAARTALDVPSKAEVQYNSVPVGMILPYWGTVAPLGYVPCSGQTVTSASFPELVAFLGGTTSAVVPDLRGEFLRGWDNGRGVDVGRAAKGLQLDQFQSFLLASPDGLPLAYHSSTASVPSTGTNGGREAAFRTPDATWSSAVFSGDDVNGSPRTGSETRPRNVSVLYCIKAYSSVTNFTTGLNLAGLVNDYSTLTATAAKYADFTGTNQVKASNGYQKLPGGLILQWGTSTSVAASTPITFPIAFTSTNYGFTASGFSGNLSGKGPLVSIANQTATGMSWGAESAAVTNYTAGAVAIVWTAVGF